MKKENLLTLLILLSLVVGVLIGQFIIHDPIASRFDPNNPVSELMSLRAAAGANPADEAAQQAAAAISAPGAMQTQLSAAADPWRIVGDLLFIRPLRAMVIPIVFLSVVTGVCSIGTPKRLGVIGGATIAYYLFTTLLAVLLGMLLVNTLQPGRGVSANSLTAAGQSMFKVEGVEKQVAAAPQSVMDSFLILAQDIMPSNLLKAAVDGNILGIIGFAVIFGLALVTVGNPAKPVIAFLEGAAEAVLRIILWLIWLAPIAIVCLVAARVGEVGLAQLIGPLARYMMVVILGLTIFMFLVLPAVMWLLARVNPYRFLWDMRRVMVMAFSTSSSNATLPVTIEECLKNGCSKRAVSFAVPLGTTVNQNGTALYEAVAVGFLFQMFAAENPAFNLGLTQQFVILITATLAAIGAAGIPGAGLVTMAIVIGAVNSSLKATMGESAPQLPLWTIGIIIGVDRVLDMCRTVVNVMGDAMGARIITRLAPDDEPAAH
jgi:solute carrier family 1 (high affinity glutamate transporter) protein 1